MGEVLASDVCPSNRNANAVNYRFHAANIGLSAPRGSPFVAGRLAEFGWPRIASMQLPTLLVHSPIQHQARPELCCCLCSLTVRLETRPEKGAGRDEGPAGPREGCAVR